MNFNFHNAAAVSLLIITFCSLVWIVSKDHNPEMDDFGKRGHLLMDKDGIKYNVKWYAGKLYTVELINEQ